MPQAASAASQVAEVAFGRLQQVRYIVDELPNFGLSAARSVGAWFWLCLLKQRASCQSVCYLSLFRDGAQAPCILCCKTHLLFWFFSAASSFVRHRLMEPGIMTFCHGFLALSGLLTNWYVVLSNVIR
mmetsp:Transcript_36203/g.84895  ORF Transcript_36203/g.84895 Transcript_36203/m.84895 type:complete len:128 (+) Transcript_36203:517-900(+)